MRQTISKSKFVLYRNIGYNGYSTSTPVKESYSETELIEFAVKEATAKGEAKFMAYPWGLQKNGLPRGYSIERFDEI